MTQFIPTADLVDIIGESVRSCDTQFRTIGGRVEFHGPITTIRCFQDNGLVKQTLNSEGNGGVLVVDGDASVHTALVGDLIAGAGLKNNWAGVIINGAVRDSAVIAELDFGCKALGTNPRKSSKDGAGEKNVTVHFGGVDFVPGQYVYADADGVVVTEEPITPPQA
ncbi:ribonuclease E activity regulator RraA [Corynebacterium lowii]|uniref:4-hydroxy-4-methyl-2-oxoglutarate aldolase n=1 Tax=Corynebacterium lowii TaxID=1544413 RepID=A0A0Q1AI52_9CORY|nr:ribonuclease E activity regulator RraA [Corynebacterium lowii]KQB86283.1 putative regulator of ribonuclease activity [Corynebacterium lowii]MDP9850768.1 regulator of ribonuclease activity A [Corynebacterium lowii]